VRPRKPLTAFACTVVAVAGCTPAFSLRVPDAPADCKGLAAGPAVVAVFEFDGNGGLKQRQDWTYDAGRNVDAAVGARVGRNGGRTFVAPDVAHTDVTSDDFRHWTSSALQEIAGKVAGTKTSAHQSVGDWRFPQSLTTWRAALGTDFALAVVFVDAYEPAGAASPDAGTSRYDAAQTGIACLVAFADSRIVACATAPRRFGDLRAADSARAAVDDVVDKLCP
jgi:hypothetical protein